MEKFNTFSTSNLTAISGNDIWSQLVRKYDDCSAGITYTGCITSDSAATTVSVTSKQPTTLYIWSNLKNTYFSKDEPIWDFMKGEYHGSYDLMIKGCDIWKSVLSFVKYEIHPRFILVSNDGNLSIKYLEPVKVESKDKKIKRRR